ncbi:MAG TPA: EamA family transporter, partial [Longimicrobiaceae bacterium]|nr:EamA family transporter [Longimicrobiaceae bacterium]
APGSDSGRRGVGGAGEGLERPSPARAPLLLNFAAVYVIWGSTYLAIRYAVADLPPFLLAGTRFLTAGLILYLWSRARGVERPTRANWRAALLVGIPLLAGGNGGVVWAEQRVASGLTALLVATVPLWMVLLEWLGGGVRPTARVVLGLVIGFAGLGVLVGPSELLGGGGADPLGALALVGASIAWAVGSIVARRVALPSSALLGTGMEMVAGGAVMLVIGVAAGELRGFEAGAVGASSWAGLLYLIVFGSLVGFTAYTWLLRNVDVARVSTYAYVNPIVAVLLGWALADEPVTARTLVAAGVIVAGVVVLTTGRKRPGFVRPETAPARAALER